MIDKTKWSKINWDQIQLPEYSEEEYNTKNYLSLEIPFEDNRKLDKNTETIGVNRII